MNWIIAEIMPWTIPETVTAGGVVVFAIALIYRFLGQRTDPKLLELFELQTKATSKRDEDNADANKRLAEALDRSTETQSIMQERIETSFITFAQSIHQIVSTITSDHTEQFAAIGNIPRVILPTIETLAKQIETQTGSVQTMTDTVEEQNGAIQQILAAVLRLEAKIGAFQVENQRLGVEIKEAKEELVAIKGDVSKLKPPGKQQLKFKKPTPGVPVTPKPTDTPEE